MADTFSPNGRPHSHGPTSKRWLPTLLAALWAICFASVFIWQSTSVRSISIFRSNSRLYQSIPRLRKNVFNLTDFGAVDDGRTINTGAFERAVHAIKARGGGQLNVPSGTWLTAPFNLTSHMTLFLAEGAVILGIEDETLWPLLPALPSYGFGREEKGPRYGSLIHGQNLKDVVITGHNGTINGQGQYWWTKYKRRALNFTRPPLVHLMWSKDIIISNITLLDSPFWTFHPYDCKNITVQNVTIIAPLIGAPNTDGIDPDSCEDMLIENCYISVGDDGIAIKSGWDQYGIAYGRPSTNILIRDVTIRSMISAGISIGSEMSGGVSNITVENARIWESRRAIRIKTSPGRGAFIHNLTYRNLTFDNCRVGVIVKTDYNEHPDDGWDRKAFPDVSNISFVGVRGWGVRVPVRIHGSEHIPIRDVEFKDFAVGLSYKKKHIFQCSFVEGRVIGEIFPKPCKNLDMYGMDGTLIKKAATENVVVDIDYDI
ncbi:Pectin lyase-like superfamily protein [Rhynchospora pubera]|uniref:Pectin lyase-like superfamily protein n=1 Tax=Rhynchospora pubera TaxID=906938 RepID=A0AAV8HIN6_9POAL|nr:Pectin lyase-like superfamily protein [Rhynchospora pubera]KAJ4816550.1 Pectin lyase-like superfamily protein [Rhynchospora pubera]